MHSRSNKLSFATWPWVTIVVSLIAALFSMVPKWSIYAQYDRVAIAGGQWWRLLSGHATHWSADHLTWDLLMFALLAATIERRSREKLALVLLGSALSISAALWWCLPTVIVYRGLSGIDSALFTYLALALLAEAWRTLRPAVALGLAALVVGLVAKVGYEATTGATLFVDSAAAGFTPLPLVHAVGGVVGGLLAGFSRLAARRAPRGEPAQPAQRTAAAVSGAAGRGVIGTVRG